MWFITLCNNSNINKNIYGYGSYGVLSVYLSGVCAGDCFVCSPKACCCDILMSLDLDISKFYPCT